MHNLGEKRVAVVNRWCPWWLAVDDYAPGGIFDTLCRPMSQPEFLALPDTLQPLFRHVCAEERDTLQPPVLERAGAAADRNRWGYRQLEQAPDTIADLNAHVRVDVPSRE